MGENIWKLQLIIAACEECFVDNKNNCSGFVKNVAARLGIPFEGHEHTVANDIYWRIQNPPWALLGNGEHGAQLAMLAANEGQLVVAAEYIEGENGHVAIIVGADHTRPLLLQQPIAYWGRLGGEGRAGGRLSESWSIRPTRQDSALTRVIFSSRQIGG